jgi:hypothetical protein
MLKQKKLVEIDLWSFNLAIFGGRLWGLNSGPTHLLGRCSTSWTIPPASIVEFHRGYNSLLTLLDKVPLPPSIKKPAPDSYKWHLYIPSWHMHFSVVLLFILHLDFCISSMDSLLIPYQVLNIFLFVCRLGFNSGPFRFFWVLASRQQLQG